MIDPGLLRIPLLDNPGLCITTADPQDWARAIQATVPVSICEPLRTSEPFSNRTAAVAIGKVVVVASEGSAVTVTTTQHQQAQLVLPYRGSGTWSIDNRAYTNPTGEAVLFLPPAPLKLENDITSGVLVNIDPDTLLRTAISMAGPGWSGCDLASRTSQPHRISIQSPRHCALVNAVYGLLNVYDLLLREAPESLSMLALDDQLIRLTVLLVIPELSDPAGVQEFDQQNDYSDSVRSRKTSLLEELTEWIDNNLDQAISLTDLERRSGYSRRSLQYSFQTAYGCSPMQWLRQRRLEAALQRLQNPLPMDSVASVARSLGFINAASFSRDFRMRFGRRASEVLRASRADG